MYYVIYVLNDLHYENSTLRDKKTKIQRHMHVTSKPQTIINTLTGYENIPERTDKWVGHYNT